MTDTVHVAVASNARYLPHIATLMTSLAASNLPQRLQLHLLHDASVTPQLQQDLCEYASRLGLTLECIQPPAHLVEELPPSGRFPSLIWYRILLPELLGSLDRVLYLDADTLVLQDLQPLWRLDLGDALLAGVAQHRDMDGAEELARFGLPPDSGYFNSGVLLMNLQQMRSGGFTRRIVEIGQLQADQKVRFTFPDQDAYNLACAGRWRTLHPKWNCFASLFLSGDVEDYVYDSLTFGEAVASPAVLHFEGSVFAKPWHSRCLHPHRHLYLAYRARTPWPLTELEGTSLQSSILRRLPLPLQLWVSTVKRSLIKA